MGEIHYKLSKIDLKLIHLLELNARRHYSYYAKKLNLSSNGVTRRIKSLMRNNIIGGFYTIINLPKIGYLYCRVFIKYNPIRADVENLLIKNLKTNPRVGWIVLSDGKWDLTTVFVVNSLQDLYTEVNHFFSGYSNYIKEKEISIQMQLYHFNHNYLYGGNDYQNIKYEDVEHKITLDQVDFKILQELAKNARINTLELSSKLNLSYNTIKNRIKNLIKTKIILGFKPRLNTTLLGFEHYKVFLRLGKLDTRSINQIIAFLSIHPNIVYITQAIGKYDLEFEIEFEGQDQFNVFIREFRNQFYASLIDYELMRHYSEPYLNYLPGEK